MVSGNPFEAAFVLVLLQCSIERKQKTTQKTGRRCLPVYLPLELAAAVGCFIADAHAHAIFALSPGAFPAVIS